MKGPRICTRILPLLLLGACQAAEIPTFTDLDETTVRAMFDSTVSWVKAGDWTSWSQQFSEDGVLQPPNAPTVVGRAALLAWGQAFPPVQDLAFTDVQVAGEGNMAWGRSAYALTLAGAPTDTGKQLGVFRRTPAGQWQVVAVSFNSDLPVPSAAPPPPTTTAR